MILVGLYRYFPYGGLQKDTLRLVEELLSRGEEVVLLTTSWQGDIISNPGFVVKTVETGGITNTSRMKKFGLIFQQMAEETRRAGGIALAMNRLPGADFQFAADACMKTVLQQKTLWPILRFLPRYRAILQQERAVLENPKTRILLISQRQREDYLREYPFLAPERMTLLPPGINSACCNHTINAEKRATLRRELGVIENRPLVLSVGTNWRVKGFDRAMELLREVDCHYVIIGNDRPDVIEGLLKKTGFPKERFTFTGPRDDIGDLLCSGDLMLHLARNEGAGAVLLEAFACRLPVVCTEICGFSNFIQELTPDTIVPEPYSQESAGQVLAGALGELPRLKRILQEKVQSDEYNRRTVFFADLLIHSIKTK